MNRKKFGNNLILAVLLSVFCLLSGACGAPDQDAAAKMNEGQEIVYIPSYQPLTGAGSGLCSHLEANGGFLYYSILETNADGQKQRRFYRQSLTDDENGSTAEELYTHVEARKELAADTYSFFTDEEGCCYFILRKKEADTSPEQYFLCKYSIDGEELFRRDVTDEITAQVQTRALFRRAVTDADNRIYIGQGETVCLYDSEGNLQVQIPLPGDLTGMDCSRDGRVYLTYRFNGECILGTLDLEKQAVEDICRSFPGNGVLSGAAEYDILTMDQENVYGFSAGMESPETVLTWLDSDLYGNDIVYFHGLGEGTLLAVSGNGGNKEQLLVLTPTPADSVPEKEVITLGIIGESSNQMLDMLVAGFNKSSGQYRVELLIYGKDCKDLSELNAAKDKANMEIIAGNGPDLILLDGYNDINVDVYVKKGVLEDLTGYLENSSLIHRDDLLDSALKQFTYGEGLYGLPHTLTLYTISGRTSQVGTEPGWTLKDMEQLMFDHPDARLFQNCTKDAMLWLLLQHDQKNYVNWLEGTCSFDSAEFRELLEFANRFPMENSEDDDLTLENGGILLFEQAAMNTISTPMTQKQFGNEEITYIGYPGSDGCGSMLDVDNSLGILALSEHKEGAWEFMEYAMANNPLLERGLGFGFPANKELLERYFLWDMGLDYFRDNHGNLVYDQNGEPQPMIFFAANPEDFPDQEDVAVIRQLIENAEPMNMSKGDIFNIISEEAAPYFHGQKTLDEVVDIIQRRAQLRGSE